MSIGFKIIDKMFRSGFARSAAALASMTRQNQSFRIDKDGHWVNRNVAATFVSPSIHTIPFAVMDAQFCDYWAWEYLPKSGDIVVDVGAGVGDGLVTLSRLVGPSGRVIAIEAHPETYSCMLKTIECSGLENITPIWCAIATDDGELFIEDGKSHLSNSVLNGGEIAVPARSIDSLANELGLSINYLKMNIEGAEALAIEGMNNILPQHLVISCHDFVADRGKDEKFRTKASVTDKLLKRGYSLKARRDHPLPWVRDFLYGSL